MDNVSGEERSEGDETTSREAEEDVGGGGEGAVVVGVTAGGT